MFRGAFIWMSLVVFFKSMNPCTIKCCQHETHLNVTHIKQLVRNQSSNFQHVLPPPPAWLEGGWAKSTTEWQPIFCPRSTKRVKPPTPRLHTYQIYGPRIFSIHFHSSTSNALANSAPCFFLSIRTRPLLPTSPWGLFVTVEEAFSLFVLRAFPGPFSVDIHTIWQRRRKVQANSINISRVEVFVSSLCVAFKHISNIRVP